MFSASTSNKLQPRCPLEDAQIAGGYVNCPRSCCASTPSRLIAADAETMVEMRSLQYVTGKNIRPNSASVGAEWRCERIGTTGGKLINTYSASPACHNDVYSTSVGTRSAANAQLFSLICDNSSASCSPIASLVISSCRSVRSLLCSWQMHSTGSRTVLVTDCIRTATCHDHHRAVASPTTPCSRGKSLAWN